MNRKTIFYLVFCLSLSAKDRAPAQTATPTLRRVTSTPEQTVNLHPTISGDGRRVAFESSANFSDDPNYAGFKTVIADVADGGINFRQVSRSRAVSSAFSRDGERFVFVATDDPLGSNKDGNAEIFYRDEGGLRQITETTPDSIETRTSDGSSSPTISADGRTIVFVSDRDIVSGLNADGSAEVFVYETASRAFSQFTNYPGNFSVGRAQVSGDASAIVYSLDEAAGDGPSIRTLIVRDVQSGRVRYERAGAEMSSAARSLSDDGARLVLGARDARGVRQIYLFDARRNHARQITSFTSRAVSAEPFAMTISGDGDRIAFATTANVNRLNDDNSLEIYLYDVPADQWLNVTNVLGGGKHVATSSVALSDDGTRAVFDFSRFLTETNLPAEAGERAEIYLAAIPASARRADDLKIRHAASLKFYDDAAGAKLAPGMIAVAVGARLALCTFSVSTPTGAEYPAEICGTTVSVGGRAARLYYVSPTQIVFQVPPDVSPAARHEVIVTNADRFETRGSFASASVSPGVFTLGGGDARRAVTFDEDEPLTNNLDQRRPAPTASLFGTGLGTAAAIRAVWGANKLTGAVGVRRLGTPPGLEQLILSVPPALRGAKEISAIVEADSVESNEFTVVPPGALPGDVIVNEILADPPEGLAGDANADGARSGADDEFVELCNASETDLVIDGWTLSTKSLGGTAERVAHRFAAATTLARGDAIVVFGGGKFDQTNPIFGGAQIRASSSGNLSLTNAGINLIVRDAAGNRVSDASFGTNTGTSSVSDQSLTRQTDGDGNSPLVPHLNADDRKARFSPGRKADRGLFSARGGELRTIEIKFGALELIVGQATDITVTARDQYDRAHSPVSFSLLIAPAAVIAAEQTSAVSSDGRATFRVRGLSAGEAEITINARDGAAASGVVSRTLRVRVLPPLPKLSRIALDAASLAVNRGAAVPLVTRVYDDNDNLIPGVKLDYRAEPSGVVAITENGEVKAIGVGQTIVTIAAADNYGGEISAALSIDVRVPVAINEVLADVPPDDPATDQIEGDVNRDGRRDAGDEFVELINHSDAPVDLSQLILADAASDRFTFPVGTVLAPRRAAVVFGGARAAGAAPLPGAAFGDALIFAAGSLGLNDGGDRVTLKYKLPGATSSAAATIVDEVVFGNQVVAAPRDESLTRYPEATPVPSGAARWFGHSSAHPSAGGRRYSPGTRVDGTVFR